MNSQLHVSTSRWRVCPFVINRQSYRGSMSQPSRVEKLQFKWKTGTSTNVSNQYTTPGQRTWRLEGKATAQEAPELETQAMNKWMQAADNKEIINVYPLPIPCRELRIPPFLSSYPCCPFSLSLSLRNLMFYRWLKGMATKWQLRYYSIFILSFFPLLRLLHFFL